MTALLGVSLQDAALTLIAASLIGLLFTSIVFTARVSSIASNVRLMQMDTFDVVRVVAAKNKAVCADQFCSGLARDISHDVDTDEPVRKRSGSRDRRAFTSTER